MIDWNTIDAEDEKIRQAREHVRNLDLSPHPRALVAEALGRLRDDDRGSVPDAIDLLRRALGLNEEFEPVESAPAGWGRAEPGPEQGPKRSPAPTDFDCSHWL